VGGRYDAEAGLMQGIIPPSVAQLLAIGQQPLLKFELWEGGAWRNLCALAGKHYVESIDISLGGASMTPAPVGGTWGVMLANEGSIFHPDHGGAYAGYCVAGREVRMSIGARYGGVDYYWPRIIGQMEEPDFEAPSFKANISGSDYMKFLTDAQFQELDATYPNHWGTSQTFDSWPNDGLLGVEMYTNHGAMDTADDGGGTFHNVTNWIATGCTFVPFDEPGEKHVGKMTDADTGPPSRLRLPDVGTNAVAGRTYRVKFKHRIVGGEGSKAIKIQIFQTALIKQVIYFPTDEWKEQTIYFTATDTAAIEMRFWLSATAYELWLKDISVWEYKPVAERFYQLPAGSKGPYHVTYNDNGGAVKVQQGEEDEGWYHEQATKRVFFDYNKVVIDGTGKNNVEIFYYTTTALEDVVAKILWYAQVYDPGTHAPYANEAAAKAAIVGTAPIYVDPNVDIDKVWFEAGSAMSNAIRMICERCNYRFYFRHDGTPIFRPAPAPGAAVFTFTNPGQIASIHTYQSYSEIKNRIIIKGIKQAEPNNWQETVPSELVGEAADDGVGGSIELYGERTLTINNYLFQTQGPLDAMCVILRDLYKIPKWYCDLEMPFTFVPLELGDNIQWEERLAHGLDVTQTGIIRDIKIANFAATYKVEKT